MMIKMPKFEIAISSSSIYDSEVRGSYIHGENKLILNIGNIWKDTGNLEEFIKGINVIYLTELLCSAYHGEVEFESQLVCYATKFWGNQCYFFNGAKRACGSHYHLKIDDRDL